MLTGLIFHITARSADGKTNDESQCAYDCCVANSSTHGGPGKGSKETWTD